MVFQPVTQLVYPFSSVSSLDVCEEQRSSGIWLHHAHCIFVGMPILLPVAHKCFGFGPISCECEWRIANQLVSWVISCLLWCCQYSWYASSTTSWGYSAWESRVSSSRSSGRSDRESMSSKWLCWWVWMVRLEGVECCYVIVCIHMTSEGIDGPCSDSLHGCLCFCHWEVVNVEFHC